MLRYINTLHISFGDLDRQAARSLTAVEFLLFGEFVYLCELPGDTDGPAEAVASDEEGLHAPAPEMAERKDVKMAHDSLPGDDVAVHCILLQAITQTATSWRSPPTVGAEGK